MRKYLALMELDADRYFGKPEKAEHQQSDNEGDEKEITIEAKIAELDAKFTEIEAKLERESARRDWN